jgi:tetratricopeptide (TPR) repeat protein
MSDPREQDLARRLAAGEHEQVAAELEAAGDHERAAVVLEQVWRFSAAARAFLRAQRPDEALRAALEARDPDLVESVLVALEREGDPAQRRRGVDLLRKRRRHAEAARLLATQPGTELERARELSRAGDPLAAARALHEAGRTREALEALGGVEEGPGRGAALALAAALSWSLGDAEQAARRAQAALRSGSDDEPTRRLLARALGTLGHDLAAQIVSQDAAGDPGQELPARGRYHVTGVLPASLAGAAWVGVDRVTLQETEIHVLLAESGDTEAPDPAVRVALRAFAREAQGASALGHPAIRPVLRVDPDAGLLLLPRAEGARLNELIRPPGMPAARARSMVAFLLEGLVAAHAHGLVHGSILPSQIVCDAVGRPLLGPFGLTHLSGLFATRTSGLEELLAATAPERRADAPPTTAGDVWATGVLWAALRSGRIRGSTAELSADERALVEEMMAEDPADRPTAAAALERVLVPVADPSRLTGGLAHPPPEPPRARAPSDGGLGRPVVVTAHASWPEEILDALCRAPSPWMQAILDREGRTFWLAPWPEGCRVVPDDTAVASLLAPEALSSLEPAVAAAFRGRLRGGTLVATSAGEWMLALDRLLASAP